MQSKHWSRARPMRRPDNASVTNQEARQVFRRTWLGIWYRRNYTAPMIITGYFSSVRQQLYTLIFSLSVRRSTEVISDHCLLLTACARCLVTLLTPQLWFTGALCSLPCALLIATWLHTMQHKQKRTGLALAMNSEYFMQNIVFSPLRCSVVEFTEI